MEFKECLYGKILDIINRRYRNRVEFKAFSYVPRFSPSLVDIETEWNLKTNAAVYNSGTQWVDIETEWNLKSNNIFPSDPDVAVDIETEWNLKVERVKTDVVAARGRYRNRVEFKAGRCSSAFTALIVDIETEWNLKISGKVPPRIHAG